MKLGCFFSLLLYAAISYGYYVWLGQTFEGNELWIASLAVGLIATFGVGALCNSFYAWRDGWVLNDALIDMSRRDGKRTAVAGTLEPVGRPLTAPLSGKPCVLYEYTIFRNETRTRSKGGTETIKVVDFTGLGKAECIVQSTASRLRLIGFPDLDPIPENYLKKPEDVARARQYAQSTAWENTSGLGVVRGARTMFAALTGNDESLKKDWRMISVRDCLWLRADAAPLAAPVTVERNDPATAVQSPLEDSADESDYEDANEDEYDEDDDADEPVAPRHDASGYRPQLAEKRIEPGQQVVVVGQYDEVRQGIVSGGTQLVKIYLEDVESVARKLASTKRSYLFGGILTLVIVNVGAWGAQEIYRRSDDAQRTWRQQIEQAVRDGDIQAIDKLRKRGADLNARPSTSDVPLLFAVRDPAIARLLIERGADVNATDSDGTTPLMQAVRSRNPEVVKVLIEAHANLDARNTNYHTTALMDAEGRCEECAELLRKAGAQDNRVTVANGEPIDESHEAFAVCRDYLSAVFAADPAKLRELSTAELGEHFASVDFPTWQESRPTEPRLASGFVREDHATLTIVGPNPRGADRTWIYQLQRSGDRWLVSRERWAD
jgi:hypothetical protein